jgi:hypothetical protein
MGNNRVVGPETLERLCFVKFFPAVLALVNG